MSKTQNRAGASLKALRTSHGVSQPLVAAMAGTSTAYLAKVEDGMIAPTTSYMRKVTEAVVRLMQDPPKPCPILGCDNTKHIDGMDGRTGLAELHHADEKRGEGWTVNVERLDGQDHAWSVYAEVSDDMALAASDFLAFSAAYQEASAYAAVLNGRGAVIR
ncbi:MULTISPECIES: helix-turn-helix domain-containing protein [unclassified Curtobacterium]|uniref:helix-turn-helix domain-containing protein n=1 Tax=unclassified Curtobacterium TaxID=257496 RepID=UPI003A7F70FA